MKGYKAFGHGMVCRGKQYAENTVFEEDTAEICKSGMHFCASPLDCLDYYPLIDNDGNLVEIAEVEALDECKTDDNKKFCTKKLKIGGKINIAKIVDAEIEIVKERRNPSGDDAQLASSGNGAQLASSGDDAQLASSGDDAQLASSGYGAKLASSGENSIVAGVGIGNRAKAGLGSWIVLAEWTRKNGKYKPVCVKSAIVDGKTIKPDTWYECKNGDLVEILSEGL